MLFSGTMKLNLDPFDEYSKDEIWQALEHAHLTSFVENLKGALDYECSEGGENLRYVLYNASLLTPCLVNNDKNRFASINI